MADWLVIAFENGYVVPIAGKQKSGAKAADASAQDQNSCHMLVPRLLYVHDGSFANLRRICAPNSSGVAT